MTEKIAVLDEVVGKHVIDRIVDNLNEKTFTIVSYHSRRVTDPLIWQNFSLKQFTPVIKGTLFRVPLYPRRQLVFDLKDQPVVIFESTYRFEIVRRLSEKDTLTRVVLVSL